MKLHREAYAAADRKDCGLGFCHRLKRHGSMASSTSSRVAEGEGDGSTANWLTLTRPPAAHGVQQVGALYASLD